MVSHQTVSGRHAAANENGPRRTEVHRIVGLFIAQQGFLRVVYIHPSIIAAIEVGEHPLAVW